MGFDIDDAFIRRMRDETSLLSRSVSQAPSVYPPRMIRSRWPKNTLCVATISASRYGAASDHLLSFSPPGRYLMSVLSSRVSRGVSGDSASARQGN